MIFDKLSGYKLKYLALFCMLADHTGVIFRALLPQPAYFLLRAVGRLSFPLFAFLLTEGFFHTKNRKKYGLRLLLFAFLSELPFDLAFGSFDLAFSSFDPAFSSFGFPAAAAGILSETFVRQNVFFTLFSGFAAMCLLEKYSAYAVPVFLFFGVLGEGFRTDCGAAGIFCILLFYFFRKKMPAGLFIQDVPDRPSLVRTGLPAAGAICVCLLPLILLLDYPLPIRLCTFAAAVPVLMYDGSQGEGSKYFFYLFYPSHLLLLKALACFIH